jgi:hypothetical protein
MTDFDSQSPTEPGSTCVEQVDVEAAIHDDPRLERIHDYLNDSSSRDNFAAVLGGVNGDLLLMEYRIKQTLEDAMQPGTIACEELEPLMPTVNVWLKIVKQMERVSRLLVKLDDHERNSNSNAAKLALATVTTQGNLESVDT